MAKIYCTKCGVRGNSKCPHCRSIFSDSPEDFKQRAAQDYFEMFMAVAPRDDSDRKRLDNGEDARFEVKFWTFSESEDEAIHSILNGLKEYLPLVNLEVASCVHNWELMPGEISSIGCGHIGPPKYIETIPADPYAVPAE